VYWVYCISESRSIYSSSNVYSLWLIRWYHSPWHDKSWMQSSNIINEWGGRPSSLLSHRSLKSLILSLIALTTSGVHSVK
jgi:hypothetical protein